VTGKSNRPRGGAGREDEPRAGLAPGDATTPPVIVQPLGIRQREDAGGWLQTMLVEFSRT
jgi:hypothetical protein